MNKSHKDLALLILRVGISVMMLVGHGLPKLKMLFSGNIKFPALFGLPSWLCLGLTTFAEFFCAALIILGVKTKLASIPLIITMLVAMFMIHGGDPWFGSGSKELAILYLVPYLALFFAGSGSYSVDKA